MGYFSNDRRLSPCEISNGISRKEFARTQRHSFSLPARQLPAEIFLTTRLSPCGAEPVSARREFSTSTTSETSGAIVFSSGSRGNTPGEKLFAGRRRKRFHFGRRAEVSFRVTMPCGHQCPRSRCLTTIRRRTLT